VPTLPPELTEWLPSGFFTALLGLLWYELKAGEARFNKRMDELREDMKASEARQRDELKAMDARHREDMKELRDKVDALPSKIMELLRTASQPVAPDR